MKTIYKYKIDTDSPKFSIDMPIGWKFIRAQLQNGNPFLWAEVKDGVAKKEVHFQLFGTGHEISDDATYLTTYDQGPFVLHLYQLSH